MGQGWAPDPTIAQNYRCQGDPSTIRTAGHDDEIHSRNSGLAESGAGQSRRASVI
jgi:hypothetical protein